MMGYSVVAPVIMERTLESITRWINMNVMVEKLPI